MAGFLASLTKKYHEQLDWHRNRRFLDAAMASCALVAMAEGTVSFRHRVRIDQVMETLDSLRTFDPHEGVELFNQYIEGIRQSFRQGRESAIEAIKSEVATNPDKAALLVLICLAVSEKNGRVPLTEQIASLSSERNRPETQGSSIGNGEITILDAQKSGIYPLQIERVVAYAA